MGPQDVIRTFASMSDSVIVGFSGGKDSVVTLDLCRRYFPPERCFVFYMYHVRGLSFHEAMIRWAESRYGVTVYRVPHFELGAMFRYGLFRLPDDEVPAIEINDIYAHVRRVSGFEWIAAGERISDSIMRRAMMKQSGSIVPGRRRVYPVAHWKKSHVLRYIRQNRLKTTPESKILGDRSFGRFAPGTVYEIKRHFPKDYERIREWFPFVEAAVKKYEFFQTKTGARFK